MRSIVLGMTGRSTRGWTILSRVPKNDSGFVPTVPPRRRPPMRHHWPGHPARTSKDRQNRAAEKPRDPSAAPRARENPANRRKGEPVLRQPPVSAGPAILCHPTHIFTHQFLPCARMFPAQFSRMAQPSALSQIDGTPAQIAHARRYCPRSLSIHSRRRFNHRRRAEYMAQIAGRPTPWQSACIESLIRREDRARRRAVRRSRRGAAR